MEAVRRAEHASNSRQERIATERLLDQAARRELGRLAARTHAHVELVESHAPLEQVVGVGALPRYHHRP
jgi:hypothetical protein